MNQPVKWRKFGDAAWNDINSAVLVDGIDGGLAINTEHGYVTMDRDGNTRYSPTIGPWEGRYQLDNNFPLVRITPNVVTYVLEIVER